MRKLAIQPVPVAKMRLSGRTKPREKPGGFCFPGETSGLPFPAETSGLAGHCSHALVISFPASFTNGGEPDART